VTVRRCRCACKPISILPSLRRLAMRARGKRVADVRRLAKRVVLDLECGCSIAIEPRMTGLMLLADPPDREHLRIEIPLGGDGQYSSLWFWDRRGLGTVRLYEPGQLDSMLGSSKLGPDALALSPGEWQKRLARTRRPIKVALMDQKTVSGIGNLYASEILHRAGLHPERRTDQLKPRQVRRLCEAIDDVLSEAIRYEGSTLGDATYRNALNQNGRYQSQHLVYQREGEPCRTCGRGQIERIVQSQRSTFFCRHCQR